MKTLIAGALLIAGAAGDARPPLKVGQCIATTVKSTDGRLQGDPSSGSAITYANGLSQVSYDVVPGIASSRRGDPVRLCVVALPKNCPKGDDRGVVYRGTNGRTGASWKAPDSEHECGGA